MRDSLRSRAMNHKFHYDTPKQALRWLRVHESLSPARTDHDCERIYNAAMADCAARMSGVSEVEVISLGCGGGQKDALLIRYLIGSVANLHLRYAPVDVSVGLAIVARSAAIEAGVVPDSITPMCIDLAESSNWKSALSPILTTRKRIVCFFGMLPNFVSNEVMPQLGSILRDGDFLLLSANLAPGNDYHAGVINSLPLYDNELTRDWLWSVLLDIGVEKNAGEMRFSIVPCPNGDDLLRIESRVVFNRECRVEFGGESFIFGVGDSVRLFFSYRHTPARLATLLATQQIIIQESWINKNGDEGVFLCRRTGN